jgi:hypothetical protein
MTTKKKEIVYLNKANRLTFSHNVNSIFSITNTNGDVENEQFLFNINKRELLACSSFSLSIKCTINGLVEKEVVEFKKVMFDQNNNQAISPVFANASNSKKKIVFDAEDNEDDDEDEFLSFKKNKKRKAVLDDQDEVLLVLSSDESQNKENTFVLK